MVRLTELKVGEKGRILKVEGQSLLKRRLQTMGVLPGEIVVIEKIAPLGDPIDLLIKGYHLSLRKEEAENIYVEVLS